MTRTNRECITFAFQVTAASGNTDLRRPGPAFGIMAEWLRRQTRNLMGSALVGSNPADVVVNFAFALCPFRRPWSNANTVLPLLECFHSTRVVFIPSKDKIRVRVPMDAIARVV